MNDDAKTSLDRQMGRVEELVDTLEKHGDAVTRATAQELMKTLLALHRAGLERLLKIIAQDAHGTTITASLGRDSLTSNLLLLHGLHPVDIETRVCQALDQVRPLIRGHGGDVELVEIAGQRVRIRLHGNCSLSDEELEHSLEEAITAAAPDARLVEVEDLNRGIQTRLPLQLVH